MAAVDAQTLGMRIAEARSRAAVTQAELASAVSLDRSVLAKIEGGTRRVTALELSRIADELGERIEWFVTDAPEAIVSHRNLAAPGQPSPAIDRLIERVVRNVEFLMERDPILALQPIPVLDRPNTADEAEASSLDARAWLGLEGTGPVGDLADAAARVGVYTFSFALGADAADAASVLHARGAVVVVNGDRHVGRRRLAVAHELGHCLFADEYTVDWSVVDAERGGAWEGRLDRFARALLLPRGGVSAAWRERREAGDDVRTAAVRTASVFRVDMATLARRLLEIGAISGSDAAHVRAARTTRADIVDFDLVVRNELEAPRMPRPYERSVLRLYRNDVVSAARATDLLFDLWNEADLPVLPRLPESSIWQFVS